MLAHDPAYFGFRYALLIEMSGIGFARRYDMRQARGAEKITHSYAAFVTEVTDQRHVIIGFCKPSRLTRLCAGYVGC